MDIGHNMSKAFRDKDLVVSEFDQLYKPSNVFIWSDIYSKFGGYARSMFGQTPLVHGENNRKKA